MVPAFRLNQFGGNKKINGPRKKANPVQKTLVPKFIPDHLSKVNIKLTAQAQKKACDSLRCQKNLRPIFKK